MLSYYHVLADVIVGAVDLYKMNSAMLQFIEK